MHAETRLRVRARRRFALPQPDPAPNDRRKKRRARARARNIAAGLRGDGKPLHPSGKYHRGGAMHPSDCLCYDCLWGER